jgi:hypothetical protein
LGSNSAGCVVRPNFDNAEDFVSEAIIDDSFEESLHVALDGVSGGIVRETSVVMSESAFTTLLSCERFFFVNLDTLDLQGEATWDALRVTLEHSDR